MGIYSGLIKPFLFRYDPEVIHYRLFRWLKILFRIPGIKPITRSIYSSKKINLRKTVFGIEFPNSVGLAAGFDKDAKLFNELDAFGFGFIEVGTVTPLPQPGNSKPRMFRLTEDEALLNRMGFNNDGVKAMIERLKNRPRNLIIGANIGKNKDTPIENAISDYEICFRELFNYVDYFAVNVSSPNTPGLRSLQEKGPLLELLVHLQNINSQLSANSNSKRKPILLKIAPDLTNSQMDDIVDVVVSSKLDGIVAVNTTISRENLKTPNEAIEKAGAGGISGKPVAKRSTEVIKYLSQKSANRFQIIGVGGIHSADDAIEKLNAGASLVQIYTGFIYEGPRLIKRINSQILKN